MEDNVNWNWKEIFDKSEDSLNLFVKEHKNLLPLKIDEFHLRINQNSDGKFVESWYVFFSN